MVINDSKVQAKSFLYELNNTQHEYGFAATEQWTLTLVTAVQKTILENKFYPVVSVAINLEQLTELFDLVKIKLEFAVSTLLEEIEIKKPSKDSTHLLAYCVSRVA